MSLYYKFRNILRIEENTIASYFEKYCFLTKLQNQDKLAKVLPLEYILSLFLVSLEIKL